MGKLVVIESPYQGNVELNKKYALECLKDSLERGESPFASHLLYTQVLDDTIPEERQLGIAAGLEWLKSADEHIFYVDMGMSSGMIKALELSIKRNQAFLNSPNISMLGVRPIEIIFRYIH